MIRTRIPGWLNAYRTRAGLWLRDVDLFLRDGDARWNVRGGLYLPTGEKRLLAGQNLITTAGELHYAQLIAQETPTNAFGVAELATTTPTHAAGNDRSDFTVQASSEKAVSATFPKRNDTDTDNSGKGTDVFTYKYEWSAGDGNWSSLDGGLITNASPGANEPILTGFDFAAPIDKDSSTALTVWVNHAPTGV